MTFHRLTDTNWLNGDYVRTGFSGTIPDVAVDWMNNDPTGATSTPAPAAGAINNGANPYVGSHFVGGKEDAADVYANRAAQALSNDIDDIDNSIRRGIATIGSTTWTAPSPATNIKTFSPPISVYVGSGTPVPAQYLEIVDSSNYASIVDSGGGKVYPTGWTIGAIDAAGFAALSSITLSASVTPGTVCQMFFGTKTAVAELPRDALLSYIRSIPEISNLVQRLFLTLHAPVGSSLQELWNAPWDSTVAELALSGLNDRYKCADYCEATAPTPYADLGVIQSVDAGWAVPVANAYGAGAWIYRRGMAPTVISHRQSAVPLETDKLSACWRAVLVDDASTWGGSVGFAVQGGRNTFTGMNEKGPGFAAQLYHCPVRTNAADWFVGTAWTVVPDGAAAHVQYSGEDLICTLTDVGNWFSSSSCTGINTGVDMLEVVDYTATPPTAKYWVIHRLVNAQTCVLRTLAGHTAPISRAQGGYPALPTVTNVTVTWHKLTHSISDGAAERQVQLNIQGGTYDPGQLALPSPANYGVSFYPGLPNVGLTSNYGSGLLQNFDIGVVSIYGNVVGQLLPQPPVAVGGLPPLPEPDVALFIGVKSPVVDAFGQTPSATFAMISSMGVAYFPKVFTGAIGCYDPLFSQVMRVESNVWVDTLDGDNTVYGTGALALYSDYVARATALGIGIETDGIVLACPALTGARIPVILQDGLGVSFEKELSSGAQRWQPLDVFVVEIGASSIDVTVDPTQYSEIRFTAWSIPDTVVGVTVHIPGASVATAGVATDDPASGLAGRIYRLAAAIDPSVNTGTTIQVDVDFVVDDVANVSVCTDGVQHIVSTSPTVNDYMLFELSVFGNRSAVSPADQQSYVQIRPLFTHNKFI